MVVDGPCQLFTGESLDLLLREYHKGSDGAIGTRGKILVCGRVSGGIPQVDIPPRIGYFEWGEIRTTGFRAKYQPPNRISSH